MAMIERAICPDCAANLAAANLIYKKLPHTEDMCSCEWCGKRRYCTKYRIRYGKEGK